jgi:hypothetical protein
MDTLVLWEFVYNEGSRENNLTINEGFWLQANIDS